MKKLIYLLLIAFSLFSCSKDEIASKETTNKITFTLHSQEQLSNVTLIIKDANGNVLKAQDYTQVSDISYDITSGTQIVIHTLDEDYFMYVYKLLDSSGNVKYEQVVTGNMLLDIIRNYNL